MPTDETFERFRRKLADVVTVAINSGIRVGAGGSCHCPLGCSGRLSPRPISYMAAVVWGISATAAKEFAYTFDGADNFAGPYADLGRLYRARFP